MCDVSEGLPFRYTEAVAADVSVQMYVVPVMDGSSLLQGIKNIW